MTDLHGNNNNNNNDNINNNNNNSNNDSVFNITISNNLFSFVFFLL